MKTSLPVLVATALLCGCASPPPSTTAGTDAQKEIAALRQKIYPAYFSGHTETLRQMESPDLVVTGDGQAQTTEGRYETIATKVKDGRWFPGGVTWADDNTTTRVFGSTAVVHGMSSVKTADGQEKFAWTEVWAKAGGPWRLVHLQYQSVK